MSDVALIQAVIDSWDHAQNEKYDELRFQKFADLGGVEPIRKLLQIHRQCYGQLYGSQHSLSDAELAAWNQKPKPIDISHWSKR